MARQMSAEEQRLFAEALVNQHLSSLPEEAAFLIRHILEKAQPARAASEEVADLEFFHLQQRSG